jgi:hypothetical protein
VQSWADCAVQSVDRWLFEVCGMQQSEWCSVVLLCCVVVGDDGDGWRWRGARPHRTARLLKLSKFANANGSCLDTRAFGGEVGCAEHVAVDVLAGQLTCEAGGEGWETDGICTAAERAIRDRLAPCPGRSPACAFQKSCMG